MWWGLTGFYPSALIFHVFYQNLVYEFKSNVCKFVFSKQLLVQNVSQSLLGNNYVVNLQGITIPSIPVSGQIKVKNWVYMVVIPRQ